MKHTVPAPTSRIDLIDALRGSALLGILLLHSIEHWDFLRNPESSAPLIAKLDGIVHTGAFFLFGGKAYGIFAMMFGVSFFIILDRWSQRGIDVRGRFLWRLALLGLFGYVHAILYCGDILLILAILGLPLVFIHRWSNRLLLWVAALFLLQIPSLWESGRVLLGGYVPPQPRHWAVYGQLFDTFAHGTFAEVSALNAGRGQLGRILWTLETGRYTQMMGLFVIGFLLGRSRIFESAARSSGLAQRALLWGGLGFVLAFPVTLAIGQLIPDGMPRYVVSNLASAYLNLAQLAVWVGGFIWLYQRASLQSLLRLLVPYGRMSLTCYVTQGLIGIPLFYGYGFALYQYLGSFWSILLGCVIFAVQLALAHLWLRHFTYGPLEWIWRSLTFFSFATPFRRTGPLVAATLPAAQMR
jgi:uncharacterized protein